MIYVYVVFYDYQKNGIYGKGMVDIEYPNQVSKLEDLREIAELIKHHGEFSKVVLTNYVLLRVENVNDVCGESGNEEKNQDC